MDKSIQIFNSLIIKAQRFAPLRLAEKSGLLVKM